MTNFDKCFISTILFFSLIPFAYQNMFLLIDFFQKNYFLLQIFENKIPFHTFSVKAISSVFDEVKLAVNEVKIPNVIVKKYSSADRI